MADSNKKKRKKAAKSRPEQVKPIETKVQNQPADIDQQAELNQEQLPDQVVEVEPEEELVEELEDSEEYSEPEVEIEEESQQQAAPASPYDDIITHRTSSAPTDSKTGYKLQSGLSSTVALFKTRTPWIWIGSIAIVVLFGLIFWWQWQRSYVGVVNGQHIPTTDLVAFAMSTSGSDALTQLTQQALITQEGYRQNINISEEALRADLQPIIDESGGQEAYEEALKQYGIPESHLLNQIRAKQILVELTKDKVQVTDQEVEDYYNNNKETLDPDGTRGFDNIKDLVRTEITEQKQEAEFATFVQTLTEKSKVSTNLSNANLTFAQFLKKEVFSIPGDIAKLFNFSN